MQKIIFATLVMTALLVACTENMGAGKSSDISVQEAYDRLVADGLGCDLQGAIVEFDEASSRQFRDLVANTLSREQIAALVTNRERQCDFVSNGTNSEVGTTSQGITLDWAGEAIEEASGSGGYNPSYIFRDSGTSDWMCNSGAAESPADYVFHYDNIPGAFANRGSLRIRGTNSFASCYVNNPTMARVYTDDDIRACIGYWSVYFCASAPTTTDTAIWR